METRTGGYAKNAGEPARRVIFNSTSDGKTHKCRKTTEMLLSDHSNANPLSPAPPQFKGVTEQFPQYLS